MIALASLDMAVAQSNLTSKISPQVQMAAAAQREDRRAGINPGNRYRRLPLHAAFIYHIGTGRFTGEAN